MSLDFDEIKKNYNEIKNEWNVFSLAKKKYKLLLNDIIELCDVLKEKNHEQTFSDIRSKLISLVDYEKYIYNFVCKQGEYRCSLLKNILPIGEENKLFIRALFDEDRKDCPVRDQNYYYDRMTDSYTRWNVKDKIYLCHNNRIFEMELSEMSEIIIEMINLWKGLVSVVIWNAERSNYFIEMYRNCVHIPMFKHIYDELVLKTRDISLDIKINNKQILRDILV